MTKTTDSKRVKVSGFVTPDLLEQAKIAAAKSGRPVGAIVERGVKLALREIRENPETAMKELEEDRRTLRYKDTKKKGR